MNTSLFKVLSKGLRTGNRLQIALFLGLMIAAGWPLDKLGAQQPCEDGVAGQYPCLGMDLLCVRSLEEMGGTPDGNGNDCWGWSSDEREFMLFGRSDGTTIIEVTDPVNPVIMTDVPTASTPSLWRDIKVIGDVAYIVSEAGEHGMQVVDLSQLPSGAPGDPVGTLAYYTGFGNAHNLVANPETGFVYGVGTNTFGGGLHIVDVNEPSNPVLVGSWEESYIHDAQAVIYNGPDADHQGKEIVFAFSGFAGCFIIDAEDKTDCQTLSAVSNEEWVYSHQGWLTEDHRFVLLNDEIDESTGIAPLTRTWVLDVQDLDNAQVIGYHEGNLEVTDHNLYIRDGLAYQANYYAGMQVLDIVDAANAEMELVAYFDTNPFWDGVGTSGGAWNVYPFFESGNIAISTQSHFFMVRPSEGTSGLKLPENQSESIQLWMQDGRVKVRSHHSGLATVMDMRGRVQATWPLQSQGWSTFITEGWASGAYLVKTQAGVTERFLVH